MVKDRSCTVEFSPIETHAVAHAVEDLLATQVDHAAMHCVSCSDQAKHQRGSPGPPLTRAAQMGSSQVDQIRQVPQGLLCRTEAR